MIVIQASMTAKPGKRDDAIAAFRTVMAGSQLEAGCIVYRYMIDIDDPALFHILEIWADEPALMAHVAGAPFAAFMAVIGELVDPIGMTGLAGALESWQFPAI